MMKIQQKHLMLTFFIYPILPLGLFAGWIIFVSLFGFLISGAHSLSSFLFSGLLVMWFSGGLVGIYAGLKTILNQNSKLVFWLFAYAAMCYMVIAGVFVFEGFEHEFKKLFTENARQRVNVFTLLHLVYISISLWVIIRQLVHIYQSAFGLSSKQGQPAPNIENTH